MPILCSLSLPIIIPGFEWEPITNKDGEVTSSTRWSNAYAPKNVNIPGGNPWHGKGHGKNQWLKFTFPVQVTIDGFRTKANQGWDKSAFKNYRFEMSNNGNTWTTLNSGQGINQDCCGWQEFKFDPATAKFFRLYMVNNWGYGWLSIQQIQLSFSASGEKHTSV